MINTLTASFNPLSSDEIISGKQELIAENLRRNVSEIVGSYHHKLDFLYEALQNAIDACEKAFYYYNQTDPSNTYIPYVKIYIDINENSFKVLDNGLGMNLNTIKSYYFKPFQSLKTKSESTRQRGEKGVGATFLSFGTNKIIIGSKFFEDQSTTIGTLQDGLRWCNEEINLLPMPNVSPVKDSIDLEDKSHGTFIQLFFDDKTKLKDLSELGTTIDQWEKLLRLYTAVGSIAPDDDSFFKNLKVRLELRQKVAEEFDGKNIETGFLYPHLLTSSNLKLENLYRNNRGELSTTQRDMDVLYQYFPFEKVGNSVNSRMDNMRYLRQSKRSSYSTILNEYRPEAYVAFTYSSDFWDELNYKNWGEDHQSFIKPGIIFSTKSQRIGEQKKIDFVFRSGDYNRFFILLNMKNLKADIGRKSIDEEIIDFANFFANSIQREFVDNDDSLKPSPGPFDEGQETELESIKDKAYELPIINFTDTDFIKIPSQEQDVIALFFNLLGKGYLKGYKFYSTHISKTYDGVGTFELQYSNENIYSEQNLLGASADKFSNGFIRSPKKLFMEFKYNSDGLVNDVKSGYKRLQDVKWLICWSIGSKNINEGISITDITIPSQVNKRDYYGVTHLMTQGQNRVQVICMEKVLEILKQKHNLK